LDALARKLEATRHDAYDQVRLPVEADHLPDDVAIGAEAALPQPIAQDRDCGLSWGAFGRHEPAADERVDTQGREQIRRHLGGDQPFRRPGPCQVDGSAEVSGQAFEGLHLLLPVDIVQRRHFDSWPVETGAHLPNHRQSVRFVERKRFQEDAVDETEHRSRRAHAKAERQHGDSREARPPDQHSYAEAHILTKRVEPRTDPHIADVLLDLVDATDLQSGCPASLVTRHALRNLFLNQQVGVAVDLVAEVPFDPVAPQEIAHEVADEGLHAFDGRHHVPSTGRNARPIATAMRPQFSVSAFSCRRPATVSR
jgi:hypothetical protein